MREAFTRRLWWFPAPVLVGALAIGCARPTNLVEHERAMSERAREAPIVIVGMAGPARKVGSTVLSRNTPGYPMQLYRVAVRLENILQAPGEDRVWRLIGPPPPAHTEPRPEGSGRPGLVTRASTGTLADPVIPVFYFGLAGCFNGPRPLGFDSKPDRRILWLRRDGDLLRMACDGWDYCTEFVDSGAHLRYRAAPGKPLEYALADLLLTRGDGEIDDLAFARQVEQGVPDRGAERYVVERLQSLASTEVSAVRAAACLQLWVYAQHRETRIQLGARESMRLAGCRCLEAPIRTVCQ